MKVIYFLFAFFFGAFLSVSFTVLAQTIQEDIYFDYAIEENMECTLTSASTTQCKNKSATYTAYFYDLDGNIYTKQLTKNEYTSLFKPNGNRFNPIYYDTDGLR